MFSPSASRVVRAPETLGGRVVDEPLDGRIGEGLAVPGAVAGLVQKPGNGLLPPVLQEELVDEPADRGLVRVGDELPSSFQW